MLRFFLTDNQFDERYKNVIMIHVRLQIKATFFIVRLLNGSLGLSLVHRLIWTTF